MPSATVTFSDTMNRIFDSPLKKAYSFVGFTLIVVLIFLFGAIRPTLTTITRIRGEINQKEKVNNQLQTKINTLEDLQVKYHTNRQRFDFIDHFFPSNMDYSLVMVSLDRIVNNYGFELTSLSITENEREFEGVTTPDNMDPVAIRMVVEGRKSNLIPLIDHLENLPIFPSVTRFAWAPSDSDEEFVDTEATISLITFKTTESIE
jgi:hypothetical protein